MCCTAPGGHEGGSPAGVTVGDWQGVGGRVPSREDQAGFSNKVTVANSVPKSGLPGLSRVSDDRPSGPHCVPP